MTSSTKPEVHNNYIALSSEEDRATAIGNVYRNLREIRTYDFETRERTDRQTYTLITILCNKYRDQ